VKRRVQGLRQADQSSGDELTEGLFLVRVDRALYHWHAQKPYYSLRFIVIGPTASAGTTINGRLYCTQKALWKLTWFLRDFGYDADLLDHDEIDDRHLVGLRGVIKTSRVVLNGTSLLNLDAFAPESRWADLSSATTPQCHAPEVA
jgi:hypothetical protein